MDYSLSGWLTDDYNHDLYFMLYLDEYSQYSQIQVNDRQYRGVGTCLSLGGGGEDRSSIKTKCNYWYLVISSSSPNESFDTR